MAAKIQKDTRKILNGNVMNPYKEILQNVTK